MTLHCLPHHQRSPAARLVTILSLVVFTIGSQTEGLRGADPRKPSSSRKTRKQAIAAIPIDVLKGDDSRRVLDVVHNPSIFRRSPTHVIDCDPQLFEFLLRYPEVVVGIWRTMGVSKVSLVRKGESTFVAADGEGTVGTIDVLHRSHDKLLVYAHGSYDGPLAVQPVQAQCVLLLHFVALQETNDRCYITTRLDSFVRLERSGVKLLAKTFQPVVGRVTDYNFTESMAFLGGLNRIAERNPKAIERLSKRMKNVLPETVRQQFVEQAHSVATRNKPAVAVRPRPERK